VWCEKASQSFVYGDNSWKTGARHVTFCVDTDNIRTYILWMKQVTNLVRVGIFEVMSDKYNLHKKSYLHSMSFDKIKWKTTVMDQPRLLCNNEVHFTSPNRSFLLSYFGPVVFWKYLVGIYESWYECRVTGDNFVFSDFSFLTNKAVVRYSDLGATLASCNMRSWNSANLLRRNNGRKTAQSLKITR
jgi:hypothetical protein